MNTLIWITFLLSLLVAVYIIRSSRILSFIYRPKYREEVTPLDKNTTDDLFTSICHNQGVFKLLNNRQKNKGIPYPEKEYLRRGEAIKNDSPFFQIYAKSENRLKSDNDKKECDV